MSYGSYKRKPLFHFFLPRVFIFGTIIAFGMKHTVKVSQYGYDLGFKGQIYFKSVKICLAARNYNLSFFFYGNDCL